ncbi:RcnB family protein [Novosphingobium sp. 9]|uniref:RcnB family protein n=1 Tax=Novosphingobium sp. 9 TaxID=2025349 RepID=UPI0021B54E51|nr:RcnB family protein [Novosphingobium sp. 9]
MPRFSSFRFTRATCAALAIGLLTTPVLAQSDPHHHDDGHGGGYDQGHGTPPGDGHGQPHGGYPHGGYAHGGYPHGRVPRGVVVVDRGHPGWWRGTPAFAAFYGPRPGYYYAPGYGYYPVPVGYAGRAFAVGVVLPMPMRSYVVVEPAAYGLAPAPMGYGWYFAGSSFVMASTAHGTIVRVVAGGW